MNQEKLNQNVERVRIYLQDIGCGIEEIKEVGRLLSEAEK